MKALDTYNYIMYNGIVVGGEVVEKEKKRINKLNVNDWFIDIYCLCMLFPLFSLFSCFSL